MNIRHVSNQEEKCWEEFVFRSPESSLFHSFGWKRVLEKTFAYGTDFFAAYEEDQILGVLPLYSVPKPLGGMSMVSVPFGVYGGLIAAGVDVKEELWKKAQALAQERKVDVLELRQVEKVNEVLPTKDLYYTFVREIFDGEEKNMSAIPRKQRRMIRQGIGHGLVSKIGGKEYLNDFYFIYSSSLRNLGTPAFPLRFFKHLLEEFQKQCRICIVQYGEKTVAAVMTFFDRDRVMPYYGGGLPDFQRYAIYDFMYWEVMRFGWEHGYKVFDFGRSKRDTGPFHFKRHWGFEPQALPYQYFLPRGGSIPNLNPSNPKLKPFISLWKKLPLGIANRLGPFLIKYLP